MERGAQATQQASKVMPFLDLLHAVNAWIILTKQKCSRFLDYLQRFALHVEKTHDLLELYSYFIFMYCKIYFSMINILILPIETSPSPSCRVSMIKETLSDEG